MDKLKKTRTGVRSSFTKLYNALKGLLAVEPPDEDEIEASFELLEEKLEELCSLDRQIYDFLVEGDTDETGFQSEIETCDEYKKSFHRMKVKVEKLKQSSIYGSVAKSTSTETKAGGKRRFKLPTIELKKFGDDVKEWLPFWAQFEKINNDIDIVEADKFQYLIQATVPGSRARLLVESFPPTGENYTKAIISLKARFGRDDLLVEVYVRELLKLILQNMNKKVSLSMLYDKLESQFRALETLNVASKKYAAMLYPLVESCLPEDVLRVWQRSSDCDRDKGLQDQLTNLMNFLRKEVENEERITLAVAGFGMRTDSKQNTVKKYVCEDKTVPSAMGLVNYSDSKICVFCKETHKTEECPKAKTITLKAKQKLLAKQKLCFVCLLPGHLFKTCRCNINCLLCDGKHVAVMCPRLDNQQHTEHREPNKNGKDKASVSIEKALSNNTHVEVMLQTLKVWVRGENTGRFARALFDTGSQRSYVTQNLAIQMGYSVLGQERVIHALFGGSESEPVVHNRYRVRLKNIFNEFSCNFEALEQPVICGVISPVCNGPWVQELIRNGIQLSDDQNAPIEILIGADIAGKLLTGRRYVLNCGMVALETSLGSTLLGKSSLNLPSCSTSMTVTTLFCKEARITDLWTLDVLGIQDPIEKKNREQLEIAAQEHFNLTVKKNEEGRYVVEMPWLEDHAALPSNYTIARKRLEITIKKLKKEGYYEKYDNDLQEWKNENIIEEVHDCYTNEGHYLPHRAVIKESSSTPVRPVFDASAKEKNAPSLNSCLEKGANLIELIPAVLLRFRLEKIGVSADIRRAFLQICVQERDRNFLKFLWEGENGNLKTFRHCRVVFGVSCSPFLLGAVIRHLLNKEQGTVQAVENKYSQMIVEKLLKSFYVDNCLASVSSVAELNQFINQSVAIFSSAKFDLRCWEYTYSMLPENTEPSSILGLNWCRKFDTISLSLNCFKDLYPEVVTKRAILTVAHRIFDPIGFTSPTVLCPKILLQEAWAAKTGWEVEVDENIKKRFLRWFEELNYLTEIKIPRWLFINSTQEENLSLHTFCDASKVAYAAVVFLRVENENGVKVQLVHAKSRVSPNKTITIPRLELLSALIGARLAKTIIDCLTAEVTAYYWSDSSTVISWIQRADQWGMFVRNRVEKIRRLTLPAFWKHVPGHMNPADLPSRGCSPKTLLCSKFWEGPDWLKKPIDDWPNTRFTCDEGEINKEKLKGVASLLVKVDEKDEWYFRYFSKFRQICRLVGWIRRFIFNSRHKVEERLKDEELTYKEMQEAVESVIKFIQKEAFDGKNDKLVLSLRPFTDDQGILRVKSRLSERKDSQKFKCPILLPGNHPVVKRLIYEMHRNSCHAGVQILMSIMRQEYWLTRARKSIRDVVKKCSRCRRYQSKLLDTTPVSLPEDRVRDAAVFEVTGLDMAGPVYLRDGEKAWICLFTCAIFRAVHLELVTSMSCSDFIQALRRFIARRGRPSVIYSDNGTNFLGTENAFEKLDWTKILSQCTSWRIDWKFNPVSAPWWGGWWERLVGLMKQLLRKVLGRAALNYEQFQTVLCDCEMVLNSRPLTYISEDIDDMIPLTPACFLLDIKNGTVPDCDVVDAKALEECVRYRQKVSENLRRRFRNEYLGQLQQVSKRRHKTECVKKGDVVLIANDNKKRLDWPLAVVEELIFGKDGEVRLVRVKTTSGTMVRPIQRICLLETIPWESNNFFKKAFVEKCKRSCKKRKIELEKSEETIVGQIQDVQVTRKGREIRKPERYT